MPAKAKRHNPFSRPVRRHQPDVRQRESAAQRGYDTRWRKERLRWLHENPLCRPCDKRGRVKAAKEVDHITPHNGDHALFWDRGNWQSICRECHEEKSARERRKGTRASVTPRWLPSPSKPLTVVCGPPSAGKTTYVREQAGERDLVLDLDVLAEAMGKPLDAMSVEERSQAIRERNSRLAAFCEDRTHHPRCWLIATAGSFRQRKFWRDLGAEVVVVNPGREVCRQRIVADETRPESTHGRRLQAVERWN